MSTEYTPWHLYITPHLDRQELWSYTHQVPKSQIQSPGLPWET